MFFIGIDVGTSSISGVVYNIESHSIETVTKDNNTYIETEHKWQSCQSPEQIAVLVEEIVEYFTNKYISIKGIGVTGQMHGVLYVDSMGIAVSPLYTWQDGRGNLIYQDSKSYSTHLSEQTGYSLSTGFGLVTHFYNLMNNQVPAKAHKLCTIMDYVVMRLSNSNTPFIDYSNGASLGFFDVEKLEFDKVALQKVGIEYSILPELKQSATLVGKYQNNVPVYSAIGDNQAAFLGSVRSIESSIHVTVGTSSQISVYSKEYITSPLLDTRPFPGGGYILVGAALCGGQAFTLLKDFYKQIIHLFAEHEISDEEIYKKMLASSCQSNSDAERLIVSTLFDGTRINPDERGAIKNISRANFTHQNMTLGFLNGISNELYTFYETIPSTIKQTKSRLVGSGNGLTKNVLLCDVLEKQFQHQLEISHSQEEAALGACICAIYGGGYTKSLLSFEGIAHK